MDTTTFEQAKTFFLRGLEHSEAGRNENARQQFEASLALLPGRASTLTNLGVVLFRLGRHADALEPLEDAISREPDNLEAWAHRAMALSELGKLEPALAATQRTLELAPGNGMFWGIKGDLLKDLGRHREAIAAYEQALVTGGGTAVLRYSLAALRGDADRPDNAPAQYVQALFDTYAAGFDEHLARLGYRAPELLLAPLGARGLQVDAALDLGCGTGLCAPLLRPLARRLDGVDLSANMVQQARARGLYDEVVLGDAVAFLQAPMRRYGLVVAADVFIYVGVLDAMFAAVSKAMTPGGVFCFSVEAADEHEDVVLRPSLRYAHSMRYIRTLAAQHGFDAGAWEGHALRHEQGQPIQGLFAWLTRR